LGRRAEGVAGQRCWAKGERSALGWLGKEQDRSRGRAVQAEGKKNGKQREKAMGRLEKNWAAAKTEEGEGKYRFFYFLFIFQNPIKYKSNLNMVSKYTL